MRCSIRILLTICLLASSGLQSSEVEFKKTKRQSISYPGVVDFLSTSKSILQAVYDVMHTMLRQPDLGISGALFRSKEHEILGRLMTINNQLVQLDTKVQSTAGTAINTILDSFPDMFKLELRLNDLAKMISQVQSASERLESYLIHGYKNKTTEEIDLVKLESDEQDGKQKTQTYQINNEVDYRFDYNDSVAKRDTDDKMWLIEKYTLQEFASWATSQQSDSILSLLGSIHRMIVPPDRGILSLGVLDLVSQTSKEMKSNTCNLQQSPHQVLYNLYQTVAMADLKGHTMLMFSYMLLKMYNKGNFTVETELAKSLYERRTLEKINAVRAAMQEADRSMFKCDPKQYVEGVNYVKLTKLLQGYIENEVNLNKYSTCRENCAYYDYTEYNGCYKNQFCAQQTQCKGKVVECRYIDSDMNICKSSDPNRRYDWVEYENGRVLGSKGTCENRNFFKVDSWWRYLFWHCSYCFCLCDENDHTSDRYFNLREVTSDIEKNRVVTGVRLIKNNQIIHLQIQEGVLGPAGTIDQETINWKNVDNYSILDHDVYNNIDYHTMNWRERTVDIDDAFGPAEHVLTGVRFRKIGTHLNVEIRTTPFNFTTGELFTAGYSFWIGNDNTEASQSTPRKKIELENPDIPIRKGPHMLDSKHDQYITFQASNMDTDASQSTVPFLDAQALTSHGFPLSGLGLIHRGKKGSGGFLAPKLITYDFSPHLVPQFPEFKGRNV